MSTYAGLHYHIVFTTKHRQPWLRPEMLEPVHEYLGGVVNGLGGVSRIVGGVEDHVHLLVSLTVNHRVSDFMRDLKKSSSIWLKRKYKIPLFHWQDGYSAVTVSPSARGAVFRYIKNQAEHHKKMTFEEELRKLLEKAGIEYDERYLL
jgi:putative transposase